jgi:hypothetical protein
MLVLRLFQCSFAAWNVWPELEIHRQVSREPGFIASLDCG